MPRKTKKVAKKVAKKEQKKETSTYYKSKNGRFYKKVVIDGKTRCRFVSSAEATGKIIATKKTAKKAKPVQSSGTSSTPQPPSQLPNLPPSPKPKKRRRKKPKNVEPQDAGSLE